MSPGHTRRVVTAVFVTAVASLTGVCTGVLGFEARAEEPAGALSPPASVPSADGPGESWGHVAADSCKALGCAPDSAEHSACVLDLVTTLREMDAPSPEHLPAARLIPHLNPGDRCAPLHPAEGRRLSQQGSTSAVFFVGLDGRAREVLILHSSGFASLDLASARCFRDHGRFVPFAVDGRPVGKWQRAKYTWRLTP